MTRQGKTFWEVFMELRLKLFLGAGYDPMRTVCRNFAAVAVCVCLLLGGCNSGDRPPLGNVTGTVTLDGKLLAGAHIIFEPSEGGRASTGTSDDNGQYKLIYIRKIEGAKVGPHIVKISLHDSESAVPQSLPAKYNIKSELREQVNSGANVINFSLLSK
jgi:hypothetical protein